MRILVSACLLGENCKYNGGNNLCPELAALARAHTLIPVCPEVLGELPIPRNPAEIVNGVVRTRFGQSVDEAYRLGAERALDIARREGAELAILQSRSPSCGVREVYDGSFRGVKRPGQGIFTKMLSQAGIPVLDVGDFIDKYPEF